MSVTLEILETRLKILIFPFEVAERLEVSATLRKSTALVTFRCTPVGGHVVAG
jgi:hypothetical protein